MRPDRARHLVDDLGCEKPMYGFGASPAVAGDTVVLPIGGEQGAVAGFDAATGEVRWRVLEDQFFAQSAMVAELAGRREAVVLGAKMMAGLDPADGSTLWSFEHGAEFSAMVAGFLADRELPLINGERVLFLWRGEARDVAIAGDMIGMRREEPMHRLAGTDLWWWQTALDPHARISYVFLADDLPVADPSHPRRETSTVLGPDMNWRRGETLDLSWFAMPEWPGHASGPHRGRLERLDLQIERPAPEDGEAPPPVSVNAHVWLPPGYDDSQERYPVIYVHNPFAREDGGWPENLDRLPAFR